METRLSRWTNDPIVIAGEEKVARITERDIAIFKLLNTIRYLPLDYIHAFIGGNIDALANRLHVLSRKPNSYLNRPDQQRENYNANYRRLIYENTERARDVLRKRAILPAKRVAEDFPHELMISQIAASFLLAQDHTFRIISYQELLGSGRFSRDALNSQNPAAIPVTFDYADQTISASITADWKPFVIERNGPTTSYMFFPGIEADCGTEPIAPTEDLNRSSILRKILTYKAIADQGIHKSRFGAGSFFVPFITNSEARMHSMITVADKITGGSRQFLFKWIPGFTSLQKPPPPTGHMAELPWKRAGHADFYLKGGPIGHTATQGADRAA